MAEMAGPASEAVHISCGSNFFPRLASQEHADWLQYEQMIMAEPGTSLAQPEPSDPEFLRRCAKKAGLSADLLDDLVDAAELNDLNALSVCHLEVDDAADKLFLTQDEAKALLKVCKRQCQLAGVDFGDGTEVAPRTPEDDWEWCPAQPQPPVSALTPPQPLQLATGPASSSGDPAEAPTSNQDRRFSLDGSESSADSRLDGLNLSFNSRRSRNSVSTRHSLDGPSSATISHSDTATDSGRPPAPTTPHLTLAQSLSRAQSAMNQQQASEETLASKVAKAQVLREQQKREQEELKARQEQERKEHLAAAAAAKAAKKAKQVEAARAKVVGAKQSSMSLITKQPSPPAPKAPVAKTTPISTAPKPAPRPTSSSGAHPAASSHCQPPSASRSSQSAAVSRKAPQGDGAGPSPRSNGHTPTSHPLTKQQHHTLAAPSSSSKAAPLVPNGQANGHAHAHIVHSHSLSVGSSTDSKARPPEQAAMAPTPAAAAPPPMPTPLSLLHVPRPLNFTLDNLGDPCTPSAHDTDMSDSDWASPVKAPAGGHVRAPAAVAEASQAPAAAKPAPRTQTRLAGPSGTPPRAPGQSASLGLSRILRTTVSDVKPTSEPVRQPSYARPTASFKAAEATRRAESEGGDKAAAVVEALGLQSSTPTPLSSSTALPPRDPRRLSSPPHPPRISQVSVAEEPEPKKPKNVFYKISASLLKPTQAFLAWSAGKSKKEPEPPETKAFKARPMPRYPHGPATDGGASCSTRRTSHGGHSVVESSVQAASRTAHSASRTHSHTAVSLPRRASHSGPVAPRDPRSSDGGASAGGSVTPPMRTSAPGHAGGFSFTSTTPGTGAAAAATPPLPPRRSSTSGAGIAQAVQDAVRSLIPRAPSATTGGGASAAATPAVSHGGGGPTVSGIPKSPVMSAGGGTPMSSATTALSSIPRPPPPTTPC